METKTYQDAINVLLKKSKEFNSNPKDLIGYNFMSDTCVVMAKFLEEVRKEEEALLNNQ